MGKADKVFRFGALIDSCHCEGCLCLFTYCEGVQSVGCSAAFKDWLVLEGNGDAVVVKVCLASVITELWYGDEGEFHFRKELAGGGSFVQHGQVQIAFVGGNHGRCLAVGYMDSYGIGCGSFVDDIRCEGTVVSCCAGVKDGECWFVGMSGG